jgi:ribosomal protein S18 acetylase RimI-like enzyme
MRNFRDESDYWRIRDFLRRVFLLNERRELSWQAYRFDYWRWHGIENLGHGVLERDVFIWEDSEGQIAAVLNPEGPGHVYLQVDPGYRTPELETEMLVLAEEKLAVTQAEKRPRLNVFAEQNDVMRQEILKRRGYILSKFWEHHHRRQASRPVPDLVLPEGYEVRALGDVDELPDRSFLSWKAFHPNEPFEDYDGWDWYLNVQRAPLYRRDLDLVVTSPEGELCSFCTIWFDDVTQAGSFEPVGTAPEYQRLGLGKAVIYEGLHRLGQLGADMAFVGSGSDEASGFYTSIGFTQSDLSEMWTKIL